MHTETSKRRRQAALILVIAILVVPLFLTIPVAWRQDPLLSPIGDRYHVVLFFLLPLVLRRWGPLAGRPLLVLLVSVLAGGATEQLQQLAGRSASLLDFFQDVIGVSLAGCWWWARHALRSRRRRWQLVPVSLLSLVLLALASQPLWRLPVVVPEVHAAQQRFPLLEDFERPGALLLWNDTGGAELARVAVAGRGHVAQITAHDDARWPGISSRALPWDWTGHETLRFSCRLVGASPDSLGASLYLLDRAGRRDSQQYRFPFTLRRRWTEVVVPLGDLGQRRQVRAPALELIRAVSLYMHRRGPGPLQMQVDDIRLEPGGTPGGGEPAGGG